VTGNVIITKLLGLGKRTIEGILLKCQ